VNKRTATIIGLIFLGLFLLGSICLACGVVGYSLNRWFQDWEMWEEEPVDVQVTTPEISQLILTPSPESTQQHILPQEVDLSTLQTLAEAQIPINDPVDLAQRLEGKENISRVVPVNNLNRQVGERETFWVSNTDTAENFQVETVLAGKSDHLYFWIEEGVTYSEKALNRLVEDFEENIYPTNQNFFGTEWSPGVDEDPRLYVIYATGLGENVAGYFSSANEYPPIINKYSNAHETFLLSADNVALSDDYIYGVMAHEFQHMIHWYRDRNETSWLNEGFSELATLLTDHRVVPGHDYWYADDPDSQLNTWPNEPDNPYATLPHYGSSYLFVTYFLDRYGDDATQALVSHDLNGLASVDAVFEEMGITNSDTDQLQTADDLFLDWAVTNYLKDEYNVSERFRYNIYPGAPTFHPTEEIDSCPTGELQRDVAQYGVDYILLNCSGTYTIDFSGEQSVPVIPAYPYSGDFAFWSNKGDQSNMTLTKEFDFTDVEGPLTLAYWTWYDLEEDYDYLYLEVSENGEDWTILQTPSGTDQDPSGNSYGWGYNGLSGGSGIWIQEAVDLSAYAGKTIQVRFEYITDDAVHGEGFLLDDVSVPEIDYWADFEEGDGGWQGAGFVRIKNELPQTYRLAVIYLGPQPQVEFISLDPDNQISIPIEIGGEDGANQIMLVVTGTTRYTRQRAYYQLEIAP
jgi:hypothetical protein